MIWKIVDPVFDKIDQFRDWLWAKIEACFDFWDWVPARTKVTAFAILALVSSVIVLLVTNWKGGLLVLVCLAVFGLALYISKRQSELEVQAFHRRNEDLARELIEAAEPHLKRSAD